VKTRNGFVSNSSTSSFVLVGFLVDTSQFTEDTLKQQLDIKRGSVNADVRIQDSEYYGSDEDGYQPIPEGKLLVGLRISDIEYRGTVLTSLGQTIPRLLAIQTKLGITPEDHPLDMLHYLTND
jgi:hypothetical protein